MNIIIPTLVALAMLVHFTDAYLTYKEIDTCVNAHNMLRRLHRRTNDLVWDASIAAKAQAWANKLVEINLPRSSTELKHDPVGAYGENIYCASNQKKAKCAQATLSWYDEIKLYNYGTAETNKRGKAVGHFTQVVWKATTKVGVGIATLQRTNGQIETFIVAKYSPQGNFYYKGRKLKAYTENVQPRKSGAVTPKIGELDPSLIQECKNAKGDGYCNYFIDQVKTYSCFGEPHEDYFKEHCYKKCNYC